MRNLDDFDLRPGDPGNPRRPAPRPANPPAQRSSLAGPDVDLPSGDAGNAGRAAQEPHLRRYAKSGPAFDLDGIDSGEPKVAAVKPPRYTAASSPRTSSRTAGIVVTLLVAVALVVGFWFMSRGVEPPAPGTVVHEEERTASAPDAAGDEANRSAELEAPLPALDQSDFLVRALVGALSSNPALARWLQQPNLVRTFAAAVENTSLGGTPIANLRFMRPSEPYRVIEWRGANGTELVTDPSSYKRYDLIASVFTSIDPQAAGDVYRRLHGLVQEAFAELGYPDESFDTTLATAFTLLLQTPIPATAPVLEQHLNTYRYADPRLEALQPAQKQLLRMGPDNARRIQDHIHRLGSALDLPID